MSDQDRLQRHCVIWLVPSDDRVSRAYLSWAKTEQSEGANVRRPHSERVERLGYQILLE